ncbi:MAG: (Fe-S)-binding protein [Actinobacteria bacterium]|nr:(Fe-S)-binding protein [Actinomycetota bacterium]
MPWVTDIHPEKTELDSCVQCGLCLPVCPTFRLTGRETASPRGRLQAMSAVDQGVAVVDETFARIIDFCLGCRACEPVCPGLVPYGRTLEGARAEIDAQLPDRERQLSFLLGRVVPSRRLLDLATGLLRLAQSVGLIRLVPARMRRMVGGVRSLWGRGRATLGHAGGSGVSGSVGLLVGCVQDEWFRPVNRAAVTLLELAGHRVEAPVAQTCCGALAAHAGKSEIAARLAERNVSALSGYDQVVATAAGCSAHLAGYAHWGGASLAGRAVDVTVMVSEAIRSGRLPQVDGDRGPIAVQDPCHLRHAQRVTREPRHILEAAGYEVVEIDPAGMCCGAAGLYTMLQPEASSRLGAQKAAQVRTTGLTRVASANPGCEMQLRTHLGDDYEIAHPIEWYLRALQSGG